jgi:hypothetical protein
MRREFPAMRLTFLSMYAYIDKNYSHNDKNYSHNDRIYLNNGRFTPQTPKMTDPAAGTPAPEPEEDNPVAIGWKAGREERGTVRGGGGAEGESALRVCLGGARGNTSRHLPTWTTRRRS